MYNVCGVTWGKVTHLCKAGLDYASFNGCNQDEIAQMSKHRKEKLDLSYLLELSPPLMHVVSGYSLARPNPETWYNEQVYYDIDSHWGSEDVRVWLLFPSIDC